MPWGHMGEWRHSFTILDLGNSWRWVVSFTPRPLYSRGNRQSYPLDRRLSLDAVEKRKIVPCRESNPGYPARRPSLYPLSYPDSSSLAYILQISTISAAFINTDYKFLIIFLLWPHESQGTKLKHEINCFIELWRLQDAFVFMTLVRPVHDNISHSVVKRRASNWTEAENFEHLLQSNLCNNTVTCKTWSYYCSGV
jgi:hypothetical protein